MKALPTDLPDLLILEPTVYRDDRGAFFESFNARTFTELTGRTVQFVQDNQSRSKRHVIRGLHYQLRQPQGKLVRVLGGVIRDVAVDLRKSSPTFGQWTAVTLEAESSRALWIPEGFAHGFSVLSETADVLYKTTAFWAPEDERCIFWDDPILDIDWQVSASDAIVSAKDRKGLPFSDAEVFA